MSFSKHAQFLTGRCCVSTTSAPTSSASTSFCNVHRVRNLVTTTSWVPHFHVILKAWVFFLLLFQRQPHRMIHRHQHLHTNTHKTGSLFIYLYKLMFRLCYITSCEHGLINLWSLPVASSWPVGSVSMLSTFEPTCASTIVKVRLVRRFSIPLSLQVSWHITCWLIERVSVS